MTETLCYNKGCGKNFILEENKDDACQFHPGGPIFHDALKGWSCCKKRSIDFTEFLSIPGCTSGPHNNVKPEEKQPTQANGDSGEVITYQAPTPKPIKDNVADERPSEDEPLFRLRTTIGASLKTALDKQMKEMSLKENQTPEDAESSKSVKVGESCKNKACQKTYAGEHSDLERCLHHPGEPIFHEGLKYWSCCQKKTSEFANFLAQAGCTEGDHLWVKKDTGETKECRYDWYQTATHVIMSVFTRVVLPSKSHVEVNRVSVNLYLTFDQGKSVSQKRIILKGVIDPELSNIKLLGSKVEINLKKGEPGSWPTLEMPQEVNKSAENDDDENDMKYL